MLHIVSSNPVTTDDAVLRAMFTARKSVFVDLLRWDVPVVGGAFEIDQFDDRHAVYLVLTHADGQHLASARLLPTMRPHILGTLYPMLCDAAPPRAAATFEITRFCLDRALPARARRVVRDALVVAIVDHAIASGIDRYCAIAEIGWFQQILSFGWCCMPLGLPQVLDGQMLAAFSIEIDHDTPALLAAAGIVARPLADLSDRRLAA